MKGIQSKGRCWDHIRQDEKKIRQKIKINDKSLFAELQTKGEQLQQKNRDF